MMKRCVRMMAKRIAQRLRRHKRIAIPIAANPATNFQHIRDANLRIGSLKMLFHITIHARQRLEKAARKNVHPVLDFALHAQFKMPRLAGLPQSQQHNIHLALQLAHLVRAATQLAPWQQFTNLAMRHQHRLALHFGGMRGQNRAHQRVVQHILHHLLRDLLRLQFAHRFRNAAILRRATLLLVHQAAAFMVYILGNV